MEKSVCSGCGKQFVFDERCKETGNGDLCPDCTAEYEADAEAEIAFQK